MLFDKNTYVERRRLLKERIGSGIILLMGNNDVPANYPSNVYRFRQDSSFLYFYGLHREGLAGIIDVDNNQEYLVGNDIDIDDIVWFGSVDSVADMAAQTGVAHTMPMKALSDFIKKAKAAGQRIHFLPPYRHDIMIQLMDMLGIHPSRQKDEGEIAEIERACAIGFEMHTTAMEMCRPGVTEQEIAGRIAGIASSRGCMPAYPGIVTMHGEIMHGYPSPRPLEAGRLFLCDAGAETNENYCSDHTRTMPISGSFIHFAVCRLMTERLKELGLMKGDTDEAVRAGAHAMFMPHGLGHMMGLDVHDMEGLGQIYVGFDDEVRPNLEQFGTNCLRCGRRLQEGFVLTDEPGIYFIPALIDDWRSKKHCAEFLNFDMLETYKDFGGIRIEDDILITADGCRYLGKERIPY